MTAHDKSTDSIEWGEYLNSDEELLKALDIVEKSLGEDGQPRPNTPCGLVHAWNILKKCDLSILYFQIFTNVLVVNLSNISFVAGRNLSRRMAIVLSTRSQGWN